MTHQELTEYLSAAKEAAQRAAEVLEGWRKRFTVREKKRFDLVTEADLASQKAITEFLCGRFPTHEVLGEEDTSRKAPPGPNAPPTWIIDPIDGTTNYVHDCPLYCISIGLQVAGELVVGVVYDPPRRELFWAAKGQGAWANEERLQTSKIDRLEDALLATGLPPDLRGQELTLEWWRYFSFQAQSLRRTGSTALNMAWLAAGRVDGYWAFDNNVWDVAGCVVLINEAGGKITNVDGTPYDPYTGDSLASNGPLHDILLDHLRLGPNLPG